MIDLSAGDDWVRRFRVDDAACSSDVPSSNPSRGRKSRVRARKSIPWLDEPFLMGPIPLSWISIAANLPGKALAVALAIWHKQGLEGGRDVDLVISPKWVQRIAKMGRQAFYRAVKALENVGLIQVTRRQGNVYRVSILKVSGDKGASKDSSEPLVDLVELEAKQDALPLSAEETTTAEGGGCEIHGLLHDLDPSP